VTSGAVSGGGTVRLALRRPERGLSPPRPGRRLLVANGQKLSFVAGARPRRLAEQLPGLPYVDLPHLPQGPFLRPWLPLDLQPASSRLVPRWKSGRRGAVHSPWADLANIEVLGGAGAAVDERCPRGTSAGGDGDPTRCTPTALPGIFLLALRVTDPAGRVPPSISPFPSGGTISSARSNVRNPIARPRGEPVRTPCPSPVRLIGPGAVGRTLPRPARALRPSRPKPRPPRGRRDLFGAISNLDSAPHRHPARPPEVRPRGRQARAARPLGNGRPRRWGAVDGGPTCRPSPRRPSRWSRPAPEGLVPRAPARWLLGHSRRHRGRSSTCS